MARGGGRCPQSLRRVLGRGLRLLRILRVCAKTSTGQEAYFEQKDPHPDPLPSDGRGNSKIRLLRLPKRLDKPTDGGRFSLSHPMGEGRGEGECASKSEVVFARVVIRLSTLGRCHPQPSAP